MTKHTFLVEIGTEELPPKTLRFLAQAFCTNFSTELDNAKISYGKVIWFATPRRLALKVLTIDSFQAYSNIEKRGPAIAQAFDANGNPTKAANSWAYDCGITINEADRLVTNQGKWLVYRALVKGQMTENLLCNITTIALAKLPIPKMMRWGDKDVQFIRPVHTVTMLLDDKVIPGNILGVPSGRTIRGHRFMGESEIYLEHADKYLQSLLERGRVMADYHERKAIIRREAEVAARRIGGFADLTDSLLEEVTALVEWPVVLTACFEEKFLSVPAEALVSTMKSDQKYFPVYDANGKLMPYFIFVVNIESKDPQQIISGNEKVVRPRLADAEFFFNTDCKQHLKDYLSQLDTVVFQKQLGTLRDKSNRIAALSSWIAHYIGANIKQATRAGLLSKCDLMTNMVFQFADIQGIMGMYYARRDGESEVVALAQKEQYQPRFAGDALPTTKVSCAVAIADKIDTLVGIFGIYQYPKGDKDPFALRRTALGVLRIIIEKQLPLNLQPLLEEAVHLYGEKLTNLSIVDDIIDFMLLRFRAWYQDKGYSLDTIQAILARRPTKPVDFDACIRAVSYFRTLDVASSLIATNKRISNILAKSNCHMNDTIQLSALKDPAEINLVAYLEKLNEKLQPLFETAQYQDILIELATIRELVDTFFDNVIVMAEDYNIRINRLTILYQLRNLFLQVADISLLQ